MDEHMRESELTAGEVLNTERGRLSDIVENAAREPAAFWLDGKRTTMTTVEYTVREREHTDRKELIGAKLRVEVVPPREKFVMEPRVLFLDLHEDRHDFVTAYMTNGLRVEAELVEPSVYSAVMGYATERWEKSRQPKQVAETMMQFQCSEEGTLFYYQNSEHGRTVDARTMVENCPLCRGVVEYTGRRYPAVDERAKITDAPAAEDDAGHDEAPCPQDDGSDVGMHCSCWRDEHGQCCKCGELRPDHKRTRCANVTDEDAPLHCLCWMMGRGQCCVCEVPESAILEEDARKMEREAAQRILMGGQK